MKSWPYLWCYQVSKEKGKSKEQYSDAVPCHVLSCVLVDVHVREMSAYAVVTSTIEEEESNELNRSRSRAHTARSIWSVTRGLLKSP